MAETNRQNLQTCQWSIGIHRPDFKYKNKEITILWHKSLEYAEVSSFGVHTLGKIDKIEKVQR